MWTGGYEIGIFDSALKSNSILPVVRGLIILSLIRVWVISGVKNFLLVVGSISLILIPAEFALRVIDLPISKPSLGQIHRISAGFEWELIPGAKGIGVQGEVIEINARGFRDIERPLEKPAGKQRIAILGDSFTFGMAVNIDDTYVSQLEQLLKPDYSGIEVLNFGVIGYTTWQYLDLLERKVMAYQPDLIVVGIFLDDLTLSVHPSTKSADWKPRNPFEDKNSINYKTRNIRLVNSFRNLNSLFEARYRYKRGHKYLQGIEERKWSTGPENPGDALHAAQYGKLPKSYYSDFDRAIKRMRVITKAHKIPMLILYIPDASQLHDQDRQHANRFVKTVSDSAGIEFVDATPEFEKVDDPRELYLFPMDAHTSPEGHRIMTEALAGRIISKELLKPQ